MTDDKSGESRRNFLKRGVLASAVAMATAGAAGVGAIQYAKNGELDAEYPKIRENDVRLPSNGKRVVIMGGGLAGLQAGVELAARGFAVTVLEKTGSPGGKLKSWRDRHLGPTDDPQKNDPGFGGYIREHGLHCVWGFYHNLREFLGRYGWPLATFPEDVSMYNFLDKDGRSSHVPRTSWVAPYDKLQLLRHLTHLNHLGEQDRMDAARLIERMVSFDYTDDRQRAYLDDITVAEYGRRLGLSDALINEICDSIVEMGFFDRADTASMLTMAMAAKVWGGVPRDFEKFNMYVNPTNESFLTPMVQFIRSHGGEVLYHSEIGSLVLDDGRVTGVRTAAVPPGAVKRCPICGHLIFDGMEVHDECPWCGAHSEVLRPIADSERVERTFEGDFFISAMDGPGAQEIISRSALGDDPYFQKIMKLDALAPHVVNVWYEGKGYWEKHCLGDRNQPAFMVYPTGFDWLGITICKSTRIRGQDATYTWSGEYADRDVTVIETQVINPDVRGKPTREIVDLVHAELKHMIPNLPQPTSWYVNRWYTFSCFRPGNDMNRPAVQSPIDNLFYIGDMAYVPSNAVYMEKTNVTAKFAVNHILDKIGQKEGKITILPVGTPSLTTSVAQKLYSVYLPGDEPKA